MGNLPFDGLRVVALEQAVAAPFCSRQFADLGADVVKIERPDGGDFARGYDGAVNGLSAYFAWLNRGKRSLALDVKSERGRIVCDRLIAGADVFVHNLAPGAVERFGFGYDDLAGCVKGVCEGFYAGVAFEGGFVFGGGGDFFYAWEWG